MSDNAFKPVLRFMVASDIHYQDGDCIEKERMANALKYAYEIADGSATYNALDAIYIVGDFATSGSEKQMLDFKATLDNGVREGTEVVLMMASHEFKGENGEAGAIERFKKIYNMPLDNHKVINGFHFISETTTNGCNFDGTKLEFAENELKKAREDNPKAPIFFFQHPHISDTVFGSINWGEDALYHILMNYPQVIDFSGHSHAPINDPRSIHQMHFTSLGTGSMSYFELDEFDKIYGTVPPRAKECAQMTIVEVDKDGAVRIYPYDVLTHKFFPTVWEIDTPWDVSAFKYTSERYRTATNPSFDADAKIEITDVDNDSVSIQFPQAKNGDERVDDYVARVLDENGLTVRCVCVWSDYYLSDMPEYVTVDFSDLAPDTNYTVTVTARSFWKTESKPITAEVKTR